MGGRVRYCLPMSGAAALELHDLVSEEEFLSLTESMDRVELLDGEVIVSAAPSPLHQHVLGELHDLFRSWVRSNPPASVGLAPLDVRLSPGRIVQPDLFLVLSGFSPRASAPLHLVPDLVVEVLSLKRSYDRITKRTIYADAGVPEYWIVDPYLGQIEQVSGLETITVLKEGTLSSLIAPGLQVNVGDVFPA